MPDPTTGRQGPVLPAVSDRLLAECFGRPEAHRALGQLCDTVGGRTSGTASGEAAESWARDLLLRWGLEIQAAEAFEIPVWERGPLHAQVVSPSSWPLNALAHGFCPPHVELRAAVVDLGFAEIDDYLAAGEAARGKAVLCDEGVRNGRRPLHRSEKLKLAQDHGAAALLILSSAEGGLPRTGVCSHDIASIPSLGISREDGLRLRRLLERPNAPTPRIQIGMNNQISRGEARNILADIPGREAGDSLVLAGGHLDSWDVAQGATDNGLGSAIVLEMARALASLPPELRPRRRLRFALWAAEETGLRGSKHYVERNAATLDRHKAVMNFDMTGDPYGYWVPGREGHTARLEQLADQLAPLGMRRVFGHGAGLHSDHQPFMLAGLPVVSLMGELGAQGGRYYHSIGDTFEKVSLPALCRAACVGAATLWALADAEDEDCLPPLSPAEVRAMIDAADLHGALLADGYDGPPMHISSGVERS